MAHDPLMFKWFNRDAVLCTDELATYRWFGGKMWNHFSVTHSAGEYVRTEGKLPVHTNVTEDFFGLFKTGILGIHHWVSEKHLHRYGTEQEFRYNSRKPRSAGFAFAG